MSRRCNFATDPTFVNNGRLRILSMAAGVRTTSCLLKVGDRCDYVIFSDVGRKSGALLLAFESVSKKEDGQDLVQVEGTKHQEIVYHKGRIKNRIPFNPNNFKPVDLQVALGETLSLSCAGIAFANNDYASIIFYNWINNDSVDILRVGDDLWNISAPVFCVDPRAGHKHITQLDTRRLTDMIKMFFEGGDWFGITRFHFDSWTFEHELEMNRPA